MKLKSLVQFSNLRALATFTTFRPHWFSGPHHGGAGGLLFVLVAVALIFLLVRVLATGEKS